jgi:hypothetical protein
MHRNVRIFLGSLTFVTVSVLSVAVQAPYVQAGDDAEAFVAPHDGDRVSGRDRDYACATACMRSLEAECTGPKAFTCLETACNCEATVGHGKACSPREPCSQGGDVKSACVNGVCMVQCKEDKDCSAAGGGVCHAGICRPRTPEAVAICKVGCAACTNQMRVCKDKIQKCMSLC